MLTPHPENPTKEFRVFAAKSVYSNSIARAGAPLCSEVAEVDEVALVTSKR
jgi:hypothetical protein